MVGSETEIEFHLASLDGYPYSEDMGEQGWVSEGDVCGLNFEHCFSVHDSASRTFQRIAFEEPTTCGDCSEYQSMTSYRLAKLSSPSSSCAHQPERGAGPRSVPSSNVRKAILNFSTSPT